VANEIGLTEVDATRQSLVASIVQETLKQKSMLLGTISDYTSMLGAGAKELKIPRRNQFAAATKAENTDLTAQELTFSSDTISLNIHKAIYAKLERIAGVQSNVAVQSEIIQEMANELALSVDKDIVAQLKLASAAAPDHRQLFANSPTNTIQQTDILEARRLLNVQNVPMDGRYLVLPPDQEKSMLLISDFVRADAYGSSGGLVNGEIGRLYGFTVVMWNVSASLAANEFLAYHKGHVGFAQQLTPEFETQKELKSVSDEFLLHHIYGTTVLDSGKRGVLFNSTGA
jgi:N4-gp56 family major capsid protein